MYIHTTGGYGRVNLDLCNVLEITIIMQEDNSSAGQDKCEKHGDSRKSKARFLLVGACHSMASLHLDITLKNIKLPKPVALALSIMGNEKKVRF